MTCLCCYRPLEVCQAEREQMDLYSRVQALEDIVQALQREIAALRTAPAEFNP